MMIMSVVHYFLVWLRFYFFILFFLFSSHYDSSNKYANRSTLLKTTVHEVKGDPGMGKTRDW